MRIGQISKVLAAPLAPVALRSCAPALDARLRHPCAQGYLRMSMDLRRPSAPEAVPAEEKMSRQGITLTYTSRPRLRCSEQIGHSLLVNRQWIVLVEDQDRVPAVCLRHVAHRAHLPDTDAPEDLRRRASLGIAKVVAARTFNALANAYPWRGPRVRDRPVRSQRIERRALERPAIHHTYDALAQRRLHQAKRRNQPRLHLRWRNDFSLHCLDGEKSLY